MLDFDFFNGKRVFLTGHTGFKGSWLCHILAKFGAEVTGYSPVSYTHLIPAMWTQTEQCIRDGWKTAKKNTIQGEAESRSRGEDVYKRQLLGLEWSRQNSWRALGVLRSIKTK